MNISEVSTVPAPKERVTHDVSPPSVGCGQSQLSPADSRSLFPHSFSFLLLNIRGFVSHRAELVGALEQLELPTFVCLNETLLPGTRAMRVIEVPGYVLVSRLDRRNDSGWGGIALFARAGYENCIVHVGDSAVAERSWHVLHTDRGPIAVAVWYRRPCSGEVLSIQSIPAELREFATDTVGTIILGDMNVHEASWLRHSDGTSVEGRELHGICCELGLQQLVREPTRGSYTLDLILSDLGSSINNVSVLPGIADHSAVLVDANFPLPVATTLERHVFSFNEARWGDLRRAIADTDWAAIIVADDADGSTERFEQHLMLLIMRFVPSKTVTDSKSSHAWLNDECRRLIADKRRAWGTDAFIAKRDECTAGLLRAYHNYIRRIRGKLSKLKPSSREWWRISKSLMSMGSSTEVIPPLKHPDGSWAKSPSEKAELLASTFAAKSHLDDREFNDYATISFNEGAAEQGDDFIPIRRRYTRRVLKELDEHSSTGPDKISARVLRRCRDALEIPITLLARVIFNEGRWPACWRLHWVHPLYKKKSRADPGNYRGIHLTSQLSKCIERIIGCAFLPWANQVKLFGESQYAYSTKRSHKDALAINICNWLRFLEDGYKVGLYCSDVSGAFDRVKREILVGKLAYSGLNLRVVKFLASWLEDRRSSVIVSGAQSVEAALTDSVYQGTVLGPPLWNLFYKDAAAAVKVLKFNEVVFADDLNCWKPFAASTPLHEISKQIRRCQANLHEWGRANCVRFDVSKESFHVLHRIHGCGDDFLLLGILFDTGLRMHKATAVLAREAGWRLQAVLRPRRFFTRAQLFGLYKCQVLSYVESGMVAYYHAAPSLLHRIDRIQDRFLREIGVTPEESLEKHRLAPLTSRRDIGMLGLLHKIVLGEAPSQLAALFPFASPAPATPFSIFSRSRLSIRRHNRQLREIVCSTDVLHRSLFAAVVVYNLLPSETVELSSVKAFQSHLQFALRNAARNRVADWQYLFSPRFRLLRPAAFQSLFFA